MQDPRTMMNLDHLKADQKHFTPCGLNMIIDWMYGTQIEFSTEYLTDALAAAFALEVYEMVEAIEQAVLKYQKDPEAMVILLYHIDNFTPETKQQLLFAAAEQLAPISLSRPFLGLSSSIFKRIMKLAIGNLDETGNIFEVARAILTWAAENQNIDLAKAMLNRITIENLSYVEANTLHRMAIESGLETMAASIFSRYHVLSTSPVARRLFRDEAKVSASSRFVSEQNAIRELPARKIEERLPAGKNVATEKEEMMTQFKELGPPRTVWVPTREERRAIQHVMSRLETVRFGSIPLDSTTNEMRIEITYQGPKEAAKEEAVKLFFDFEFDQPNVCVS